MQNSNAINQPAPTRGVATVLEMAALDDLGPRTRWAILNSPLPLLAYSITAQIVELNDKIELENEQRVARGLPQRPYADPNDPALDERLARGILATQYNMLLSDGVQSQDAQAAIKPLVGKPSPKTMRERRRTERRIRWATCARSSTRSPGR